MANNLNTSCIFCTLPEGLKIQAENDLAFAVFDGNPVSPGHALIIPKRHVASYFDLTTREHSAIQELVLVMKEQIQRTFKPDGFNVGVNIGEAAGQSVFHVHVHLIPRFKGDIENPRGGVRGVIPSKRSY